MNRLCPNKVTCRDGSNDYPTLNLSSEAPDSIVFTGFTWTDPNPRPCLTCNIQTIEDCFGTVYSYTSQDEADMLAALIQTICNQPPSGGIQPNGQQFTNDEQTASFSCGAIGPGRTFSTVYYTVPAGSVVSPIMNPSDGAAWIAASNASALALAQERVSHSGACIDPPQSNVLNFICCVDVAFAFEQNRYTLTGPNAGAFYTWAISSGSLPPGLVLLDGGHDGSNQAFASVEGTPSTLGNYAFTVRASRVDLPNCYIEIADEIDVFGITTTSLPDGTVGTAYSEQLTTAGGTAPITFSAGALPDGLAMDSAGLITGTPTLAGIFGFEVTITDANGGTCEQTVTINVEGGGCIDWDNLGWQAATMSSTGPATATFTPDSANGATFDAFVDVPNAFDDEAECDNSAFTNYTGPGCNANLHIVMTSIGTLHWTDGCAGRVTVFCGGWLVQADFVVFGPGTYDFPFSLPDTGGVPTLFTIQVLATAQNLFLSEHEQVHIVGTLTTV